MASSVAGEVAELLATSPEDRVFRRSLRGQLPEGTIRVRPSGGHQNNVSEKFRDALRAFEREGWIARDGEAVVVLDRTALYDHARGEQ